MDNPLDAARALESRIVYPSVPNGLLSAERFPHYGLVPKDYADNLAYRSRVLDQARQDDRKKRSLMTCCREDPLFWINTFCYTFNGLRRDAGQRHLAMVTWPFQDVVLATMFHAIGRESLVVEKIRYAGATWMMLLTFLHSWLFDDFSSILIASRKAELVDARDNPDTLFWKLDYVIERLPRWMRPRIRRPQERSDMRLANPDRRSILNGETTNSDLAAGGRRLALGLDEFARMENAYHVLDATNAVTNSRFFVSTHAAGGQAFADLCDSGLLRVQLDWDYHPEVSKDKYQRADGQWRSPFLDAREKESLDPEDFNRNWLRKRSGSDYGFFSVGGLAERLIRETCRPATTELSLVFDPYSCRIVDAIEVDGGGLSCWFEPGAGNRWTGIEPCVIGWDVSQGTGSLRNSATVAAVIGARTKTRVAEYVTRHLTPEEAGRFAVGLANYFHGPNGEPAMVNWEAQGSPGGGFGRSLLATGFRNVWYRRKNPGTPGERETDIPGWANTGDQLTIVLGQLRASLVDGRYVERSAAMLREAQMYVFQPKTGRLKHMKSVNTMNPAEAGYNHGDRVVAAAVALMALLRVEGEPAKPEGVRRAQVGSLKWRGTLDSWGRKKRTAELHEGW